MSSPAFEMSEEDKREMVAEFLSESDNHIQKLNTLLLKAEDLVKAGNEVPTDEINTMFRAAHTVKGSASMLGFDNLSHLTHEMETILDRVRNKKMVLTIGIIEVLFSAFDSLNALLDQLRNHGNDNGDVTAIIKQIQDILANDGAVEAPKAESPQAHSGPITPPPPPPPPASPAAAAEKSQQRADISKFLPAFLEDSEGCVLRFNEIIMLIEKGQFNPDQSNELFRLAHTLKGSSGVIKCKGIESVAHRMEDLLSDLRNKGVKPSTAVVNLLFKGIDWIKGALDALRSGTYQETDLTSFLSEFQNTSGPAPSSQPSTSSPAATGNPYRDKLPDNLKEAVRSSMGCGEVIFTATIAINKSAMKGLKAAIIEERLKKSGKIIASEPRLDAVPEGNADVVIHVLYASSKQEPDVRTILSVDEVTIMSMEKNDFSELRQSAAQPAAQATATAVAAAPAAQGAAPKAAPLEITTMKVDARKLDNLMNLAGELVITRARFAQLVNEFNSDVSLLRDSFARMNQFSSDLEAIKTFVRKSTRVSEVEKLSKIINQMETNLLSSQASISHKEIGAKVYVLDEATSVLGKLSSDIQSAVMQTRMVPIEGVFSRFKRLVRDTSKELGKEVNLELYGEDTELDKKIIDSLPDSLTHMIRNSVDHGIESKEARLAAGKKETGTIQLKAVHQGNSICIEIIDDGKGLDAEKLAQKAMEKGLVTEEKLAKLTEKEKLNFIFAPGFSTAEKVTGLSGRGVGMDVVKKMIESLSGTVDIETEVGKGTRFILKIPLTLAIIQALLVVINKQVFALPLESVSEIIKIGPKDIFSVDGNPMIKLRGHALSLLSMTKILGTEPPKTAEEDLERKVVVMTSNDELAGIRVDRLIGEDEIVIKAFPDYFANVKGISGASILGDGNIALILDVTAIMREA